MTDFEKWVSAQPPTLHDMFWVKAAFQAGQQAEREKYQELITAAEAVIYGWEKTMHKGPDQTADAIYRMLDVVEEIKI